MSDALASWTEYADTVPSGTHVCEFYSTPEELTATLVPYFAAGLSKDEFCIWVTSDPAGVEGARTRLKELAPSLYRFLDMGHLEIRSYEDWYLRNGHFDSDRVFGKWTEKEKWSLDQGYSGIRATGDMAWLEKKDWPGFMEYEAAIDRGFSRHRMIGLCTYCLEHSPADRVLEVIRHHQTALARIAGEWQIVPRPAEQERLAAHVLSRHDDDRRRISSHLREETAQNISAITLYLAGMQERSWPSEVRFILAQCQALCDQSLEEILALSRRLHPPLLDELGLAACLRQHVDDFIKRTSIQVEFDKDPELDRMPLEIETQFFYVAQEALTNVLNHSGSARVVVRLQKQAEEAILQVEDFGRGLSETDSARGNLKPGFGIARMHERIRTIGGVIEIESDTRGTLVTARVRL